MTFKGNDLNVTIKLRNERSTIVVFNALHSKRECQKALDIFQENLVFASVSAISFNVLGAEVLGPDCIFVSLFVSLLLGMTTLFSFSSDTYSFLLWSIQQEHSDRQQHFFPNNINLLRLAAFSVQVPCSSTAQTKVFRSFSLMLLCGMSTAELLEIFQSGK